MTGRPRFDLLVVVDPSIPGWLDAVRAAAGVAPERIAVQARTGAGAAELLSIARSLRAALGERVPLFVNDRADVARLAGAGVHLKESGLEVADARAALPAGGAVGASCHDAAGLARRAGADFVVLGPFAEVPGKGPPLGAERFAVLARGSAAPVLALGGIDAQNAGEAIEAGACGIAVVRAVLAAADPAAVTRALLEAIDAGSRRAR